MTDYSDIITHARSSEAWCFNAAGTLEQVPANLPRFDYDPVTLQPRGLLLEEQRTNSIPNSSMSGAAVGSLPTGWATSTSPSLAGATFTVVAVGNENGMSYVDIRFQGTTVAVTQFNCTTSGNSVIAAAAGDAWSASTFGRLISGSMSSITLQNRIIARTSGGAFIASNDVAAIAAASTIAAGGASLSYTLPASTGFVQHAFCILAQAGISVDVTIRFAAPQLEKGSSSTSYIPTTSAPVTRAADIVSLNTLSPWFNALEGTLFVDAVAEGLPAGTAAMCSVSLTSGASINERLIALQFGNTYFRAGGIGSGGVDTAILIMAGAPSAGANYRAAIAFGLNDARGAINGTLSSQDTSTPVPAVTTMNIGRLGSNNQQFNGWLRRVRYFPRRLSSTELQQLTAA